MAGPEGSTAFFESLASADKSLDFWPGLYHEIFHEPESEEVMVWYLTWLEARL
jgi:alpha-beta hydrolase superfamily lysophospholipase